MAIRDWLRRLFPSPAESAEERAVLREEYGDPNRGEPDVDRMRNATGDPMIPGLATIPGAEAANDELEQLDPPDPAS